MENYEIIKTLRLVEKVIDKTPERIEQSLGGVWGCFGLSPKFKPSFHLLVKAVIVRP